MKKSMLTKFLTDTLYYGSLSARVDNNGVFISELAEKDAMKVISELEKLDLLKDLEEESEGFSDWIKSEDTKSFVSNSYEEEDLRLAWDASLEYVENKLNLDKECYSSIYEYVDHIKDLSYELEQNYLVEKEKNEKLIQELQKFNKFDEKKFSAIYVLEDENRKLKEVLKYAKSVLDSNMPISPNKDTHEKINNILQG